MMGGQTVLTVSTVARTRARREMAGRTPPLIPRAPSGPTSGTKVNAFQRGFAAALVVPPWGLGGKQSHATSTRTLPITELAKNYGLNPTARGGRSDTPGGQGFRAGNGGALFAPPWGRHGLERAAKVSLGLARDLRFLQSP